jgi:ATP-binding cassette, subfamily C (CFTR/MRP), member 1
LGRDGKLAQQGSLGQLQSQEGSIESLSMENLRGTEEKTATSKAAKKSKPAIKGPSQNDVSDLTRKTGDVAVYKYYFSSIGLFDAFVFLGCTALFVFGSFFPRKLLSLPQHFPGLK